MTTVLATPTFTWSWLWRRRAADRQRLVDRLASPADDLVHVLLDETAAGVAVVDRQGCVIRINAALRRMVGRSSDIAVGSPVQGLFNEQRSHGVWDEFGPIVLEGRRPPSGFVTVLRGEVGEALRTVDVTATPLQEPDGSISGAILQLADISAQKRLESQLAQSQKLQVVGQLAGGIAHDFNNLLTAMIGAADDALERPQSDPETREDLRQIRTSAERGAALVRQLLAFGRQQALEPRTMQLNAAVDNLAALLRRLIGGGVRLELELEQPGCVVRVDPTQLDQVLVNLAVNARDAMPGGGQLTLRTAQRVLHEKLTRDQETIPAGAYAMIEVQDTGIGIPKDVLPRIFDPFFTTRRDRGGNGLGLATVHGIVRQSGGFLAVDSLVGKGTRVRIYLPKVDDEAMTVTEKNMDQAEPTSPQPMQTPAALTVLLVDDEEGIRRLAARAMTKRGWTVLSAESGEAALQLLAGENAADKLCAVVSDVVMPGMDGAALVRAIRAIRPGLPAILASGYAEESVRESLAADDIAFLPKPYALKALIAAVEVRTSGAQAAP